MSTPSADWTQSGAGPAGAVLADLAPADKTQAPADLAPADKTQAPADGSQGDAAASDGKDGTLLPFPQNWTRALVIMAHPDDPEYGVAAAVAQWTSAGKEVSYLLATRGEAGIAGMPPEVAGPLRAGEQVRACAHVGVTELDFLDFHDGSLVEGLELRRILAREIRRRTPDLVITLNHRDTWGPGAWNSADHRALGRSVLDAVGDAGNDWIFPELLEEGPKLHKVRWVAVASNRPSHVQPVDDASVEAAVASLAEHARYLQALSDVPVLEQARKQVQWAAGANHQVRFELFGG